MAANRVSHDLLTGFVVRPRRVLLSACAVALVSCGGGQSEPVAPVDSVGPTPAPMPAPGPTLPTPAPAQLVVGTAQSISVARAALPSSLRVVRSANGDGFAVWRADDGKDDPVIIQPLDQPLQRRHGRLGQPDQNRDERR